MVADKLATTFTIEDQETIQKHIEGSNFTSPFVCFVFLFSSVLPPNWSTVVYMLVVTNCWVLLIFLKMSYIKLPPIFNPDEDDDYCAWKNNVDVWQAFTKEEPRRKGPAVYFSLKGRAREAVRGISINDLKKYDGVEEIIRILEEILWNNTSISSI